MKTERFKIASGGDADGSRIARALWEDLVRAHWVPYDGDSGPQATWPTPNVHGVQFAVRDLNWGASGPPAVGTVMTPDQVAATMPASVRYLAMWCADAGYVHGPSSLVPL